jgi:hypothetical protein
MLGVIIFTVIFVVFGGFVGYKAVHGQNETPQSQHASLIPGGKQ